MIEERGLTSWKERKSRDLLGHGGDRPAGEDNVGEKSRGSFP